MPLLQAIALFAERLFSLPDPAAPPAARLADNIAKLLLKLTPEQLPIVHPIEYYSLYETPTFDMTIFVLRKGTTMPTHDHPGMTVFTVLPASDAATGAPLRVKRARVGTARVISANSPDSLLTISPASGPNMHSFTAVSDFVVFVDILGPPYNENRLCTYYSEIASLAPAQVPRVLRFADGFASLLEADPALRRIVSPSPQTPPTPQPDSASDSDGTTAMQADGIANGLVPVANGTPNGHAAADADGLDSATMAANGSAAAQASKNKRKKKKKKRPSSAIPALAPSPLAAAPAERPLHAGVSAPLAQAVPLRASPARATDSDSMPATIELDATPSASSLSSATSQEDLRRSKPMFTDPTPPASVWLYEDLYVQYECHERRITPVQPTDPKVAMLQAQAVEELRRAQAQLNSLGPPNTLVAQPAQSHMKWQLPHHI
ncbi:hypothetical protein HK105_201614 [Polyrhizophydium stewartii]|uniref:Cysteine dioxygenase n=1 Tax=Polyrhizophydium stewartii TaxID=2732419 RepID=A0ABR4NH44_9FUNG